MKKEQYKGKFGFKNNAPAHASNSWAEVDLFLDTWGFLPNDNNVLNSLNKEQLVDLCMLVMSSACRIDLAGEGIQFCQQKMHEMGISPDLRENCKKSK